MEINQYPLESFSFQDEDYYDIDFWTGSGYQTKKILGSVIKAGILAAVENIYNADGTLTGSRAVNIDGNILSFISNNQGEFEVIIGNGTFEFSKFSQTLAQIFIEIQGSIPSHQMNFDLNPVNTQLTINDGVNYASLQINGVGSALNFTDGITQYRVEANEQGVVVNNAYLLPNADGIAGQVITTDGFGNATWQNSGTTIVSWGDIIGTLADQTDLQAALDAKLNDPEGIASQYIRGDGTLGNFPIVGGGGGGSVYYFNGNTSQGIINGQTMYELSKVAQTGAAANFTRSTTGTIASFITDINEPNQLSVPAGIWLFECYLSETGAGASFPTIQCVIEKWDGTTITILGTGIAEEITSGSTKDLYTLGVTIPTGITFLATDRIVVKVDIANPQGKTITLYTEDSSVSSVTTTFSNGISSLNGLMPATQLLTTGTSGTDFNISSSVDTHTFNIPISSAANTGKLSNTDWSNFDGKQEPITLTTTGTSGAATFVGTTLNVPNYSTTDTNIYNSDGTLILDRVVSMNNFGLTFNGAGGTNGSQINISSAANRSKALNFQVGTSLRWKEQVSGAEIGGDNGSQFAMQYYDDAGVLKGTAFSISRTNGAFRLNNSYSLPLSGGTTGQVLTSTTLGLTEFQALPIEIQAAASDETTNLTIGTSKVTFRLPKAMTLTAVRASLSTAQAAGSIFTIDINQNGVSVLGTKLTIDNNEKTSTTAATPATIVTSSLTDDAEITIDIDQVGTALAKGLKITLIGTRA